MFIKSKIYLVCFLFAFNCFAESSVQFTSLNKYTSLIELYTSQGCSSCPPAENWINTLIDSENLWRDYVPVVFHVDYWDYLGWKDPFSNFQNSQRQRDYHKQGNISSVYTPGFIINGEEWRGWLKNETIPQFSNSEGLLNAKLTGSELHVNYSKNKLLELHISILGIGLKTDIKSGENQNKILLENFVSLTHETYVSKDGKWKIRLPTINREAEKYGIAIWVSEPEHKTPLQVMGGWLPD